MNSTAVTWLALSRRLIITWRRITVLLFVAAVLTIRLLGFRRLQEGLLGLSHFLSIL